MRTLEAQQYATFTVGGHFLGVDVLEVQEVLRGQHLAPVPLAPPVVAGLINVRGQIVLALDLRRTLRLEVDAAGGVPEVSVLVRTAEGVVSLQVDDIGDVVELDGRTFEAAPRTLEAGLGAVVKGVHKLERELLLVLDTQAVAEANSAGLDH